MNRRIAIYLDRGTTVPVTQIKLNHAYTSKFETLASRIGEKKSKVARELLMLTFQAKDCEELKEKIFYAASMVTFKRGRDTAKCTGIGSKISHVCKNAIRIGIDKGYLI
jgi:hypothetical protein